MSRIVVEVVGGRIVTPDGEEVLTGSSYRPGSSLGRWDLDKRPIRGGGVSLSFFRVASTGTRKPELDQFYKLVPGRQYLLATSAGSAGRGILHRVRTDGTPLESFIRGKLNLPLSIMERETGDFPSEGVVVSEHYYDHDHCLSARSSSFVLTDGKKEEVGSREVERPSHATEFFASEEFSEHHVTSATFTVIAVRGRHPNGRLYRTIGSVTLWSGADESKVLEEIKGWVEG